MGYGGYNLKNGVVASLSPVSHGCETRFDASRYVNSLAPDTQGSIHVCQSPGYSCGSKFQLLAFIVSSDLDKRCVSWSN